MSILKDLFGIGPKTTLEQQPVDNHVAITQADAQIRLQMAAHQMAAHQMAIQQQQNAYAQQAMMQQYGGTGGAGMGGQGNWGTAQQWVTSSTVSGAGGMPFPRDFRMVQKQSDLDHAVFKTPIEDLVNMWLARYGADWVDKMEVLNDEFFEWAAMRLRSVGRLEEHTVWNHQQAGAITSGVQKTVLRVVDKA